MSKQSAFTVISPLASGAASSNVIVQLNQLAFAWSASRQLLLDRVPTLHYCSLSLVDRADERYLIFEGNIDGDREAFWQALTTVTGPDLEAVYQHCEGFVAGQLSAHFRVHDAGPGTWYVAYRGKSAVEIIREAALRDQIDSFRAGINANVSPTQARVSIQAYVENVLPTSNPSLASWALTPPDKLDLFIRWGRPLLAALSLLVLSGVLATLWPIALARWLLIWLFGLIALYRVVASRTAPANLVRRALALIVLALAIGFVLALAWYVVIVRWVIALVALVVIALRRLESRDVPDSPYRSPEILRTVSATEDCSLTNHMTGITRVKPGGFRMALLRLALFVVGLAHRLFYNRGELGGIPSIHFARWVIRKGSRDLIFLSNFDGSWEGYLGDFIDKASVGLNSIWSNTETYPKTTLLVFKGAHDEPRFKAFGRNTMVPTRVWLAAYPNLSVQQIATNAKIRAGLLAPLKELEAQAWLRLF